MTKRASTLSKRANGHATQAPPHRLTVATSLVRSLLAYAQARGVPMHLAVQTLGSDHAQLDNPDRRVDAARYDALFLACSEALSDPDFGLKLGAAARAAQLGVLGFLLMASRTLGTALEAYERYQQALGETLQIRLATRNGLAVLSLQPIPGAASNALRVEAMAASIHAITQELCGRTLPWESASFEHLAQQPSRRAALQTLLRIPVSQGPNRLRFDASALHWPILFSDGDAALATALHAQLQRRTQTLQALNLVDRAAAALRHRLTQQRKPSVDEIARDLGISARALQLRLQNHGTQFRALVDRVRCECALAFLRQGASAAEVSHLLGFAEEASFFRAFRRWTGNTPAAIRAQVQREFEAQVDVNVNAT